MISKLKIEVEKEDIPSKGAFGKEQDNGKVILFAEEAYYLIRKKRSTFSEKITEKLENAFKNNSDFRQRYLVYETLKERGFVIKSGLKYGTHFRVYEKGVTPKKGKRALWEHAKYLVQVISSPSKMTTEDISRYVRLTQSVRKKLWLAIVDVEEDITFFQIMRITP